MKLSSFTLTVLFFVAALIGAALVPSLQTDLLPKETKPTLQISFSYPNASPEIVEQNATAPLENILSQITGVQKINSVSSYGRGSITLNFSTAEDLAFKKFEIAAQIRGVYKKLPPVLSYPEITQGEKNSATDSPLLLYSMTAKNSSDKIREVTEKRFIPEVSGIEGVYEIKVNDNFRKRIVIRYDEEKLAAHKLSPQIIEKILRESNQEQHFGKILDGAKSWYFLRSEKEKFDLEKIENLVVPLSNKTFVRLNEIAKVSLETERPVMLYRINGLNTTSMAIFARKEANKIQLAKAVKTKIEEIAGSLPDDFKVLLEQDESEVLEKELRKNYQRAGFSILILMLFIFLANRDWRYLLVLFTGIFINIALTSIFIYTWKINIHLYSLAGLAVSFGMIIDNAIVMLEHLHEKGNKKIFLALLGASLTTVAALLLVYFLPEEDQKNLADFAKIVTVNLGVSLLVALFFTPAFYEVLYGKTSTNTEKRTFRQKKRFLTWLHRYENLLAFLLRFRKTFFAAVILAFGLPVFMLPSKIEGFELYNNIFDNDNFKENIRPYIDKSLGGGLRPFVRNVFEKNSYRSPERTKLFVSMEMPFGTTIEQMDFAVKELETFLSQIEGLEQYSVRLQARYAFMSISFLPHFEKSSLPFQLKSRLTSRATEWEGIGWNIWGVGQGFHNSIGEGSVSFRVEMRGFEYLQLEKYAEIAAEKLLAHKRIQKVNTNERLNYDEKGGKELVLRLFEEAKQSEGINLNDIFDAVKKQTYTPQANLFLDFGQELLPTYVQNESAEKFNRYDLMHAPLRTASEKRFLGAQLADLKLEPTASSLYKENRKYIRVLGFEYMGSYTFGRKYLDKIMEEMRAVLPAGYEMKAIDWTFDTNKTQKQYALLLILIAAIFVICAVLFESFVLPLVIICIIPISFIGLFTSFSLFDFFFDQGGYAAFVLLGGLSVNAAIFILHDYAFATPMRTQKRRLTVATLQKFKPVMLTVLSTVVGLLPFLATGQEEVFWFSLACGTVGGLLFSLIGVFLVMQTMLLTKNQAKKK